MTYSETLWKRETGCLKTWTKIKDWQAWRIDEAEDPLTSGSQEDDPQVLRKVIKDIIKYLL